MKEITESMEKVECFRYLSAGIHESGRMNEAIDHRVQEGVKVEWIFESYIAK